MDPAELLAPESALGAPAPFALMQTFKVAGFTLHMAPMHLWYAGTALAAGLSWGARSPHGQRMAARLGKSIPVAIAVGINLGLVPLLFTSVAYHRASFSAGILMAWPWLAVIPLLLGSYAATYVHAHQLEGGVRRSGRAALTAAAIGFLVIGFLFTNYFSLLTNMGGWAAIHERTSVSGAVTGLALNTADPTLWPRFLMFWCLALTTSAVWIGADAVLLAKNEAEGYREWALRCALGVHVVGLLGFAACGAWYMSVLHPEVRDAALGGPLSLATGAAPAAAGLLLFLLRRRPSPKLAWALLVTQVGILLLNAIARHTLQLAELRRHGYDPGASPVRFEVSPFVAFLLGSALGVGIMVWMARMILRDLRSPPPEETP